ncbi:mucin-12-like isoform X2 [Triticum dicoccoides]|uniref:mucin-12-like isoform X2 n=1 Tax=Triticum dicoccoides TaxID=85692 RepID=UPI00189040AD|nr:mucin-12-like isoform X2 [Triticum dicoccoides]
MDALSLIDVSGEEDDFLLDLASPPQHPDPPARAAPGAAVVGADSKRPAVGSPPPPPAVAGGQAVDPAEQAPERAQSPKKTKGVNLRKSLAWDKAFFTSEGVLDTEELGIVNSTFRKSQGSSLLPGIAEEMRRSMESTTSSLESESFVLESLETELFDNVRASIQRTLGKPDKAPIVASGSSKTPRSAAKAPPVTVRKGVDRIPQTQSKIRPPASISNGSVGGTKQRPQVTLKEPAAARVAASKAAEAKPSSKPPRALPRVATMRAPTNTAVTSGIADKRSSTGGVVNRQAVAKSANSSASVPSRPGGGPKNNSTSKSGALSLAASPSLRSAPMAGGKTKSPTLISKNRTAQRIPIRSSSRSDISKVDPARASRNKSHGESASPTISPSSSVDSMSSVISGVSTASTVGRASHTSETFSTRSSSLSPSTRKSNDHPPTTLRRPVIVREGQASGAFADNVKSNVDTSTQGNGFKPSGLRRPTPKIGYFDAEKSVEQKAGARAQLQPTKVLFSPLATQNSWIPSTPKTIPATLTFEQEEPKSRAAAPSQTKASPSLPLRVAQTEVKPSKVTEHEVSQKEALPLLSPRVAQTETEPSEVAEDDISPTKASPSLPSLTVVQTEVESSKVSENEAAMHESGPLVTFTASFSETTAAPCEDSSPSLLLGVAKMEVEPLGVIDHEAETSKVSEHEAHVLETGPLVAMDIAEDEGIPALNQNVQANGDISSSTVELSSCTSGQQESETTAAPCEDSSPSQNKVSPSLLLGVAKMEVEPLGVIDHEAETSKVSEHEAHVLETGPLVAMDIAEDEGIPALNQNVQANGDISSSTVELSSGASGQPQSETTAAPCEESVSSQTKAAMDIAKENIPAMDTAKENIQPGGYSSPLKENILASHQNIQPEEHMTPVKGSILASHTNAQAIGEMTPITLLSQKLSSISLGQANGEATPLTQKASSISQGQSNGDVTPLTQKAPSISQGQSNGEAIPLTLLAQKLSSISLGDATD